MGIHPGMLRLPQRLSHPAGDAGKTLAVLQCPARRIIQNLDAESLYQVPLMLEREAFADKVCEALQLPVRAPELQDWEEMVDRFQHPEREVTIALVGKYIQLHDAYLSVVEALQHGGIAHRARVRVKWIQADDLAGPETDVDAAFAGVQGILVPGGFWQSRH